MLIADFRQKTTLRYSGKNEYPAIFTRAKKGEKQSWIARIFGKDPQYRWQREFIDPVDSIKTSAYEDSLFKIAESGVYEVSSLNQFDTKHRNYIKIQYQKEGPSGFGHILTPKELYQEFDLAIPRAYWFFLWQRYPDIYHERKELANRLQNIRDRGLVKVLDYWNTMDGQRSAEQQELDHLCEVIQFLSHHIEDNDVKNNPQLFKGRGDVVARNIRQKFLKNSGQGAIKR